jgi:hypothetical protein
MIDEICSASPNHQAVTLVIEVKCSMLIHLQPLERLTLETPESF